MENLCQSTLCYCNKYERQSICKEKNVLFHSFRSFRQLMGVHDETDRSLQALEAKETKKKGLGIYSPLQGHMPNNLKIHYAHFVQFLSSSNSIKPGSNHMFNSFNKKSSSFFPFFERAGIQYLLNNNTWAFGGSLTCKLHQDTIQMEYINIEKYKDLHIYKNCMDKPRQNLAPATGNKNPV